MHCIPGYVNIDKQFVTPVTLLKGNASIYGIPVKDLVDPVAMVPNILQSFDQEMKTKDGL